MIFLRLGIQAGRDRGVCLHQGDPRIDETVNAMELQVETQDQVHQIILAIN
jgi:hypothetical protein